MEHMDRRNFVKSAALGTVGMTGAVALGAAVSRPQLALAEEGASEADATWVAEADVVIVGGGGAGFCAALEAAAAGARVLVLEKAGFCGGDTQLSNGMLMAAGTKEQAELAGCSTDTPEAFAEQQVAYAQGYGDEDMIREMCMASPDEVEFMTGLGRVYKNADVIPPVWAYDTDGSWGPRSHWDHTQVEGHPDGHFGTLKKAIEANDAIQVITETEVAHLIVSDGEVKGVCDTLGNRYRANRGVILATASFGANKEMNRRYNHMYYWALCLNEVYPVNNYACHPANTGDGIRMAQEVGADLALSNSNVILDMLYFGGVGSYYYNELAGIDYVNEYLSTPIPGKILVNAEGSRFVQEDALWGYVNAQVYQEAMRTGWNAETSPIKVWAIQDAQHATSDALTLRSTNTAQTNETGRPTIADLCVSADTIEELAELIGVPADNLERTVERWNEASEQGVDGDYGRRTDFGSIATPPFYAVPFLPNTMGSLGGLRTDIDTHVLDVNGAPISRLYAAGTIMSGMWCGPFYPSCGWAILGTVHWGRKAGQNAAGAQAWTVEPATIVDAITKEQPEPHAGGYAAGTYEAESVGRNGIVPVTVEFSDSQILSVTVGENVETLAIGTAAIELLPERIVEAQTADIDALTGATLTSMAILRAVDDCITQAERG